MSLREDILACRECYLWNTYQRNVPFEGPDDAEMMFVGRDPGEEEINQLRPFIGPAGQLFRNRILRPMGIDENKVFISNIVCCRPFRNIAPPAADAKRCADKFIVRAIQEIMPKVIIPLGKEATEYVLGRAISTMGRTRGQLQYYHVVINGVRWTIPVIPTWHPSYILRLGDTDEAEMHRLESVRDITRAVMYCENLQSVL